VLELAADSEALDITETVLLNELVCRGLRFELCRPLLCSLTTAEGRLVLTCSTLDIVAWGDTLKEALEGLKNEFAFLWTEYAEAPDEGLTTDARKLKEALRQSVRKATRLEAPEGA